MNRIISLLIFIFLFIQSAKADTISYWKIYYNDVEIKPVNGIISLTLSDLKDTDTLGFQFFSDNPRSKCQFSICIHSDKNLIAQEEAIKEPCIFLLPFKKYKLNKYKLIKVSSFYDKSPTKIITEPLFTIKIK